MKKNPWRELPLEIYEAHMGLDSVAQEQALNMSLFLERGVRRRCPAATMSSQMFFNCYSRH